MRFVTQGGPEPIGVEQLAMRGRSSLRRISGDAFERGLRAFEAHCRTAVVSGPIYEPVEMFVFQQIPVGH